MLTTTTTVPIFLRDFPPPPHHWHLLGTSGIAVYGPRGSSQTTTRVRTPTVVVRSTINCIKATFRRHVQTCCLNFRQNKTFRPKSKLIPLKMCTIPTVEMCPSDQLPTTTTTTTITTSAAPTDGNGPLVPHMRHFIPHQCVGLIDVNPPSKWTCFLSGLGGSTPQDATML